MFKKKYRIRKYTAITILNSQWKSESCVECTTTYRMNSLDPLSICSYVPYLLNHMVYIQCIIFEYSLQYQNLFIIIIIVYLIYYNIIQNISVSNLYLV